MNVKELSPDVLYRRGDPGQFSFETTADLEMLSDVIGQPRAVAALQFGTGIKRDGFNIFALGPPGAGRHSLVRQVLTDRADEDETPSDWCYVKNFEQQYKPRVLKLPAGKGRVLRNDMERLVEDARSALRAAFESEEYQHRRQTLEQAFKEQQQDAFETLQEKAKERGLTVMRTPGGLAFAPIKDGETLSPEEIQNLSDEERKRLENEVEELQQESQRIFQQVPRGEREMREKLQTLSREMADHAVGGLIQDLCDKFEEMSDVVDYLKAVKRDVVDHVEELFSRDKETPSKQDNQPNGPQHSGGPSEEDRFARRYRVNLLVDHSSSEGAPVVNEDNPTYQNLIGRIEHRAVMGALFTDFNMIKPGALHRANGGYLILDAHKVLMQPYAWEGLKRALRSGQVKIESLGRSLSLVSTVSLEPESIPLDVKVVLVGSAELYYLLHEYDPEFSALFKVAADFDDRMPRNDENQARYAQVMGMLVQKEGLHPFDKAAMARVVEQSARIAGDAEKLSVRMRGVVDLLREADYWAGENGRDTVGASDVQQAIDAATYRSDRIRARVMEEIERETLLIDTDNEEVGQVNGLSVMQLGEFSFGRPTRITARVRLGKGEVVDIEREVALSGPIHSKGVLILGGFLGERYAAEHPFSLSASLVFEQSYGGVDGDSASSAELYALLSAISQVPIRQTLAVTGSVNQHGRVQAIGGVNEKIEGFFDVCKARGLTGEQGVLIPIANAKHLMLRRDVVEAVENGQFHIYPVETIDQGMALLTNCEAGEPDETGFFPAESVNGKVQQRLIALAEKRKEHSRVLDEREA